MSVKISDLSAVTTPLGGTETLACVQTSTKKVTTAELGAYAMDVMVAATTATPTTGDYLIGARSTDEKRMTLDNVAAYGVGYMWSAASATTLPTAGDYAIIFQGSTTKKALLEDVVELALTGVQADVLDISALGAATLAGSDFLYVCQTTTPKQVTLTNLETQLWADYKTYAAALTANTVVVDADIFYCIQGGVAKSLTASVLATYMLAEIKDGVLDAAWDAAALGAAVADADVFVLQRSDTLKTATGANIISYADSTFAASSQVTPLATGDLVFLYRSGVRKMGTIDALTTYVASAAWASDTITDPAGTDVMLVERSGTKKKVTLANVQTYMQTGIEASLDVPWNTVAASTYTAVPASTSTITFSSTTGITVGQPIRYTISGTAYYGIITAVATDSLVTVAGAPLSGTITELCTALPERAIQVNFTISAAWDASVRDVLAAVGAQYYRWERGAARLVTFSATNATADTGATQPKLNVKVGSAVVSSNDSNLGIQTSGTPGTWVTNSAVAVNTTNYIVTRNDSIEVRCTAAGTNGTAAGLSVSLTFVLV